MTSVRLTAAFGLFTPLYFLAAIVIFGLMTPGYAHASKAVSELGALGATYMLEWNVLGFGLTGALLAAFGAAFPGSVSAKWALFLTGVAFAATAIPADFDNRQALSTVAHMAASFAAFVCWLWALGSMWNGAPRGFRSLSIAFFVLSFAAVALQASDAVWPGTAQRATFAVFFSWYFAAGLLALRHRS